MKRHFSLYIVSAIALFSILSMGKAQSEVINVPPQTRVLENGWEVAYSINAGKLAIKISLPCNTFKRLPSGLIAAPRINQCTLHPFAPSTFDGDINDFVSIWERNTCSNELECCKPTCLRKLQTAMSAVPRLKLAGCDNGMITMTYDGILDDVYAACGAPPDNGFASIGVAQSMPTSSARIPIHGRWFYSSSPSNSDLRIGTDKLVIGASGTGRMPLSIDRTDVFVSEDLPIRVFKNPDTKLAIYMAVVLSDMDETMRTYTGNTRLYSGSNFVEGKTVVVVDRFLTHAEEWRWRLRSMEIQVGDITLVNVPDPKFAPGPDGFSTGPVALGSEMNGGDEFYTILITPGKVKLAYEEKNEVVLAINSRIFAQAPKRRELVEEKTPEVNIMSVDRVKIITDTSAPQLRRASATLVSHIKSSKPYKLELVPGGDAPSFVYFEQIDASCDEEGCDQQWQAITAFVPDSQVDSLMGTFHVKFNILACSPLDLNAEAEGRCIATPYVGLKTDVVLDGSFEMERNDMVFRNHLSLNSNPLRNTATVNAGQRIDGEACVTDELIGEIDASIQVVFPRVSIVAQCEDGLASFSLFEDGKPMDDEIARKLDGKVHPSPMNRGCMQYQFNAVAIEKCPRMGLGFEYEIRSPAMRNGKRDVHVTLQSSNGTDAVLTVVEGDNTGSVTLSLNSTNNYTVNANFLWDDDDDSDSTTTTPVVTTGSSSDTTPVIHRSSISSSTTIVKLFKYDSHGNLKTIEELSEDDVVSEWGVWWFAIIFTVIVIIAIVACFFCPGYGVYDGCYTSSTVSVDEEEQFLRRLHTERDVNMEENNEYHGDVVYGNVTNTVRQRKTPPEYEYTPGGPTQWKKVEESAAQQVPAPTSPSMGLANLVKDQLVTNNTSANAAMRFM